MEKIQVSPSHQIIRLHHFVQKESQFSERSIFDSVNFFLNEYSFRMQGDSEMIHLDFDHLIGSEILIQFDRIVRINDSLKFDSIFYERMMFDDIGRE